MRLDEAKVLAQECWDKFRYLPSGSLEIRLLTAFIQQIGDCRENVESPIEQIKSSPSLAEIDAALGAVCNIGGG